MPKMAHLRERSRLPGQFMKVIWSFAVCFGCVCFSALRADAAPPISAAGSNGAPLAPLGTLQAPQTAKPATEKDAVARGEIWFYQRCALCHMQRIVKDETYMPLGPSLKGLLKDAPASKEANIREFIKTGSLRMPGFQYGLDAREFDELIAFLKTH